MSFDSDPLRKLEKESVDEREFDCVGLLMLALRRESFLVFVATVSLREKKIPIDLISRETTQHHQCRPV